MRDATQIILRPLLTEKSTELMRAPGRGPNRDLPLNKYTFEVVTDATKIEIQRAVEQLGNVYRDDPNGRKSGVEKVNTIVVKGKVRRTRRGTGRTPDRKKAIVTLKPGWQMGGLLGEVFEGMAP